MKAFFTILSLLISTIAISQDFAGTWKGTITQNEGGYRSEYALEIRLTQKGDSITGKSFVFVDEIYAEMDIAGSLHNGVYLQLQDEKILTSEELEGMEWCIKSYQLLLKQKGEELKLEGHWQGKTSFSSCIPGKIFLKKRIPRA